MSNKKYTTQPRKPDFEDDFFLEPKGYEGDMYKPRSVPKKVPDKAPATPIPPVKPQPKKDKLPKGQSIA